MRKPLSKTHASMQRLLAFAIGATQGKPGAVGDWQSLGERLDVSSAVITNWKERGISEGGAIRAERVFGCSAAWVLSADTPATLTFSKDALDRADAWAHLGTKGREVVDRALDLAKEAHEPPGAFNVHLFTVTAPATDHTPDDTPPPTVPGDLRVGSVVLDHHSTPGRKSKAAKTRRRRP